MISWADDYSIHQTTTYVRVPSTSDRNFYDRFWYNGYQTDGEVMFGCAFGRYPNRFVVDAHFTVVLDGVQHSLHASGPAPLDPTDTTVGPIRLDIAQPMRAHRFRADGASHGVACDLTFQARTGSIDEGRDHSGPHGQTVIDSTRFMQYGTWQGWIEVDGRRVEIRSDRCQGLRDKSWGVRPIAEQSAAAIGAGSVFWMNVVLQLEDDFSVARTAQDAHGRPRTLAGYYAPLYAASGEVPIGEQQLRHMTTWEFELDFLDDSRRITGGRYRFCWPDGSETQIDGRPLGTFWYAGLGYEHPRWHHGLDHGGLVVEREDWSVAEVDLSRPDRQFMCHVMEYCMGGTVIGSGHTEQLFLGPYSPYGWGDVYASS